MIRSKATVVHNPAHAWQSDVFFTETIIGGPVSISLGRRAPSPPQPGAISYDGATTRLAQTWSHQLENNTWRYAAPHRGAVQELPAALRLFVERHALRVVLVSVITMLITVGACAGLASVLLRASNVSLFSLSTN